MNKVLCSALCVVSVLALPGCWGCSKEAPKEAPVTTEVPAEGTTAPEAVKTAEAAPEAPKAEEVPAKM